MVEIDQKHHSQYHRRLGDIQQILNQGDLDEEIQQKSTAIFKRLAEAEARVHRLPVEAVHFHEIGALDTIIDVVGAAAEIRILGIEKIISSALHLGSGTVVCAHGTLPVPAPATTEFVKVVPVFSSEVACELLTLTGAAILRHCRRALAPYRKCKSKKSVMGPVR